MFFFVFDRKATCINAERYGSEFIVITTERV